MWTWTLVLVAAVIIKKMKLFGNICRKSENLAFFAKKTNCDKKPRLWQRKELR